MSAKHHPIKNNSLKRKRCGHNSLITVKDYSTNNEYSWFDYNHKLQQAKTPTDTLQFAYDALGNRNLKAKENKDSLFYVNDLQGNIMATYKLKNDSLFLEEQPLYGSSRLGVERMNRLLWQRDTNIVYSSILYGTVRGNKQMEISNHLGNVLATVSDKKIGVDSTGDGVYDYYEPVEITATDYYAYGGELPERTYTNSMSEYPFGWNTQMKVREIAPTHYTAPFWEFDARLGANGRLNVDPVTKMWQSPYSVLSNNPIFKVDPKGDDDYYNTKGILLKRTNEGDGVHIVNSSDVVFKLSTVWYNLKHRYGKSDANLNQALGKMATTIEQYDISNKSGRNAVSEVLRTIASENAEGSSRFEVGVGNSSGEAVAYTFGSSGVAFGTNRDNTRIYKLLNTKSNIMATLTHELEHQLKDAGYNPLFSSSEVIAKQELKAFYAEVNSKWWNSTTKDYKKETLGVIEGYLNDASPDVAKEFSNKFNAKIRGGEFNIGKNKKYNYESKSKK